MIEPTLIVNRIGNVFEASLCLKIIPEMSDLILAKFPGLRPDYIETENKSITKNCNCGDACGC